MEKHKGVVELYTDYLVVVDGQAAATELSAVLDGENSHGKFTEKLCKKALL
jgi:hypothetical protein